MNGKKRKIVNITKTPSYFNIDIRISIHKSEISEELQQDLMNAKEELVNGNGNHIYYARVNSSEDGRDLLEIGSDQFFGKED